MDSLRPRLLTGLTIAMLVATLVAPAVIVAKSNGSSTATNGDVRSVTLGGSITPATGSFTPSTNNNVATSEEFAEEPEGDEDADEDEGPDPYDGSISLSNGNGHGNGASVNSSGKAKSNPAFINGFEGLNFYQQRYARGGNQFSVEPPDQAMCVGNGYVVEAVNDVFNVFDTAGVSQLPDNTATNIVGGHPRNVHHAVDLNSFYGYPPAINRATGIRGQFVTDPTCIYDAAANRFFLVVLTLEIVPTSGAFTTVNHLDLAVTQTGNPTGAVEHLPDRRHQRRHEHRWHEPRPIPG